MHVNRPHRVVQLLATAGIGGAQGSAAELAAGLDPSLFAGEVVFLTDGPAVDRTQRQGIPVTVLDEPDDRVAVRALADHLRRTDADLLHAHMYRAELLGARAARLAGTPATVVTVHSSRIRSAEDVAALAAVTPLVDHLIAPSAFIADKVRAEGRGGIPLTVIPNGVGLDRFHPHRPAADRDAVRIAAGIPPDALLVGIIARLEPEKGHRHLVAAWPTIAASRPDAWLLVAGDGSLAGVLRAQVRSLPADASRRVVFTGLPSDVPGVTASLDVAVLPSLREGQGIAILEAIASGIPVVASAVGGIPETIRDGVDGLLVPPADPPALASAVIRLARDVVMRRTIASAARRRVEERFSLAASVMRVEAVYDEVLTRLGAELPKLELAR